MLIAMRRGAAGWVAKILFGLLILSFAVWGIGDYLTPDADPVVAEVGDIEIRRSALDRAERQQIERMRRVLGGAFDPDDLPQSTIRAAALDQLVGQTAVEMETRALGLSVTDAAVSAAIRSNPQFAPDGAFDAAAFRRALFVAGLTEDAYVDSLRTDLARAQLVNSIAARMPPPLPLAEVANQVERQERNVAYVQAETGAIETPAPTDAELRAYVEANAERYAEPERRDVRALIVSTETVLEATEVTDAEVEARYEATKEQLRRPERRTLTQALFQSEEEAKAFRSTAPTEVDVFKNLAELAGAAVTDLGALAQDEVFPKALADVVYAAQENAATQPVGTGLGWHVVLISDVAPAGVAPLEEVRGQIRDHLRAERAETGVVERANSMEDALAAGGDLNAASAAAGLPVKTFVGVDRNGRGPDDEPVEGLPADPAFLDAIFERQAGDQSGLIELDGARFTALIVDDIHPSAPKPFEEVRAKAEEAWRTEKRREIAEERLAALTGATSLAAFEQAASTAELAVEKTGMKRRDQMRNSNALGAAFVETLFATPLNEVVTTEAAGAVTAAIVFEITEPRFSPDSTDGRQFLEQLARSTAGERAEALAAVARDAHTPEVVNSALNPIDPAGPPNR